MKDYRYIYIIMALLIPTAASVVTPIMALYLTDKIHLRTSLISLYYVLLPIFMVITTQIAGKISDMGFNRARIIAISATFGVIANSFFYFIPSVLLLFFVVVPCFSLAQVGYSQIFASAREYGIKNLKSSINFTTTLRALASLSWVMGPPLAYFLVVNISFESLFFCCGVLYLLAALMSYLMPNVEKEVKNTESQKGEILHNKSVIFLFISVMVMFIAFTGYAATIPLYITHELNLPEQLPGYIYSIAAFLEIPIMFLAARMSKRIGLKKIMVAGGITLLIFMIILPLTTKPIVFMFIAFLPAFFIATVNAMGMVYFQELLPNIPGQATSLFLNACVCGQVVGGALIGIADNNHYSPIYMVDAVLAAIGLLFLIVVKKPKEIR